MPTHADSRRLFGLAPGVVYLDAATYGPLPKAAGEAMRSAIAAHEDGSGRWIEDWDRPAESCRAAFAELIGAAPNDIALIPAASVGVGVVAARLGTGDEVVVPHDEFTSVLFPLLVAERRGVKVRQVGFDELPANIGPSTRLVAFSLVQMQTGRVADLGAILGRARAHGSEVLIDATQAIPFVDLRERIADVDYLVCAGYKHLLSPRGTAYLYVRAARHAQLEPLFANWRSATEPYGRFFGGPLTLALGAAQFDVSLAWIPWVGATESLRLLADLHRSGQLAQVNALARRLAEACGVRDTGGTLVCVPVEAADAARRTLEEAGIRASVRGSAVRFAPHVYNTTSDVERAAAAMQRALKT